MSKFDELISTLCPDGVTYISILETCDYIRGVTYNKGQEVQNSSEDCWVVLRANNISLEANALDLTDLKYVSKDVRVKESQILHKGDILICAGSGSKEHIGKVAYIDTDMTYAFGGFMAVMRAKSNILSRYVFHCLTSTAFKKYLESALNSATINNLNITVMEGFKIPVPALSVQQEIVGILDVFSGMSSNLEEELVARKKQFYYYRESAITQLIGDGVPEVEIENIATEIYRGAGIKRDQVVENGVPCVRYGQIYTDYNVWFDHCISCSLLEYVPSPKYFEHGDILFAITGESVDEIAKSIAYMGNEKCMAGGDIVVMKHKQNAKYLAYALSTTYAQMQKSKGKVKSKVVHSSIPAIKEIKVPIPPLDKQELIAEQLDALLMICDNIEKELILRKKQYEYYRDKLLTFKEA